MFLIPWRQIDIYPPLIVQYFAGEIEFLYASMGYGWHPLQFGRLLEISHHKEGVLLPNTVVDTVVTARIYYPLPVND